MKTLSERLFEDICHKHNVEFQRINEEDERRPDYFIELCATKVVAEVKQLDLNPVEKDGLKKNKEGEIVSFRNQPGARVRSKISSSAKQISNITKKVHPGILVLYDNTPFGAGSHLEPYNIKAGMYGLEQFVFTRPDRFNPSPELIDRKFGPKQKMTVKHNTSISAVAVIEKVSDAYVLVFYHNKFAQIPIDTRCIAAHHFDQYKMSSKKQYKLQDWELING